MRYLKECYFLKLLYRNVHLKNYSNVDFLLEMHIVLSHTSVSSLQGFNPKPFVDYIHVKKKKTRLHIIYIHEVLGHFLSFFFFFLYFDASKNIVYRMVFSLY